ncbi:MAG: aldehyde dehydrogenase family protein [Planctomycetota bacterium]
MLKDTYPLFVGNEPRTPNQDLEVLDKYSGDVAFRVPLASPELIDEAIGLAEASMDALRSFPAYKRREVLDHCVDRFTERFDEFAESLCVEAGKPIKDARGEVTRLIDTFRIASGEATRIYGETLPMEITERTVGYRGATKKVPIGPCSFISPFNFPLNLAAHKVAPALAVGCPFVLKPASLTPIGALLIGEVLAETDLPKGAFSILPCRRDGAALFTEDERLKLLSFTGSPGVGWDLKKKAGKKPVVLELGGNAACLVDEGSDLDDVVERAIFGAYYQSGQSCISVQRILVHRSLYDDFKRRWVKAVSGLKAGNPKDEDTFLGPMISEKEASRLEDWIQRAAAAGAKVLCGGKRDGAMLEATVLENVPDDSEVYQEEAFGPVSVIAPFDDFDTAIDEINNSAFGLQAGLFVQDVQKVHKAWDRLDVGGVVINDVPSFRVDHMPYGGVKDSGLGREGIRWAIEDMTETRVLVTRLRP